MLKTCVLMLADSSQNAVYILNEYDYSLAKRGEELAEQTDGNKTN